MHSAVEVKKLVKASSREGRLFVAEHDGELYATNSYWLVPVVKVAPLMAKYNLSTTEPGSYSVNGDVTPTDVGPPNLGPIMPRFKDLTPLERETIEGRPAFTNNGAGYLELWRNDGALVAFNPDFMDLARDTMRGFADPVVMQVKGSPGKPASVWATVGTSKDRTMIGLVMPVRI